MTTANTVLDSLIEHTGCGFLVMDSNLCIREASPTMSRFSGRLADSLIGKALTGEFPELTDYTDRIRRLANEPSEHIRLRVTRDAVFFAAVTVQTIDTKSNAMLVVFEDITTLVMRTQVLGRRVKELESRCQELERNLLNGESATPRDAAQYDRQTGLLRREYVIEKLLEEEKFSRHWRRPLSVAILRLTNLAELGQQDGLTMEQRTALVGRVGEICRDCLRSMDIIGHIDTAGLLMILPQTDRVGADVTLARIERALAGHPMELVRKLERGIGVCEIDVHQVDTLEVMLTRVENSVRVA